MMYVLIKDKEIRFGPDTYDKCWMRLLDIQSSSTDYAMKYGGWSIEPDDKHCDVLSQEGGM